MAKLVIKITVYQSVDPDLYDSVSNLPLRQRSAVIRRLWRQGLRPGRPKIEAARSVDPPHAQSSGKEGTVVATDQGSGGADGKLLRQHLDSQSLSGLSAFV